MGDRAWLVKHRTDAPFIFDIFIESSTSLVLPDVEMPKATSPFPIKDANMAKIWESLWASTFKPNLINLYWASNAVMPDDPTPKNRIRLA